MLLTTFRFPFRDRLSKSINSILRVPTTMS
jgi:hypothetical protein